jgi:uncharacterized membrane protein YhfC
MAGEEFLPLALAGIIVAIVPFLGITVYLLRGNKSLWKIFFIGWAGWFIALLIRIVPVQVPAAVFGGELQSSIIILLFYVAYASAMAGLFEEGFRYIILDQKRNFMANRRSIFSFALGWGIGEAVVIYIPAMIALPLLSETVPSVIDILPGAIERNLAILAHIAFTFIVVKSLSEVANRKAFLFLAMFLHFALNFAAVSTLALTQNIWLTEVVVALLVAVILMMTHYIGKHPVSDGPVI